MVCYLVPTSTALVHRFLMKKNPSWGASRYHSRLNFLLLGGAVFGVVDHWWNGELFLFGGNLVSDLLLGLTITVSIFFIAGLMVVADILKDKFAVRNKI